MDLVHAHQVNYDELLKERVDVLIAASGYGSSSDHLIQLSNFKANKKIALLFKEKPDLQLQVSNESIFIEKGFECYKLHSDSSGEIMVVLESLFDDHKFEDIKLIVDYSSMTKIWYGTIINYFTYNDLDFKSLVIYFCYTPDFFIPPAASKKKLLNPVPIFANMPSVNEDKPLSLIIGLGYDETQAEFLCDFLKPDDVYFFLPNPSFDEDYTQAVKKHNNKLISNIRANHLINYSAKDIEDIDSKLTSLCLNLRLKSRIIIVSIGPHTFSLASFLLNARYPDIEIWNISSLDQSFDLKPEGIPVVYKAILTNEE